MYAQQTEYIYALGYHREQSNIPQARLPRVKSPS